MKIESIYIENFKVFRDVKIHRLPDTAFFVGANGTGKSTLFDVFGFLKDVLQHNARIALQKRGGYHEVVSRNSKEPITIALAVSDSWKGKLRVFAYGLKIGLVDGQPQIIHEKLAYKRTKSSSEVTSLILFRKGAGFAVTNEEDWDNPDVELIKEKQTLDSPDISAIKGLGQFKQFSAASSFRKLIENWRISDFHISDARPSKEAGHAEHLSITGDNLPLVAQFMFENHPKTFQRILDRMKERIPGVDKIEADMTQDGRVLLKFQDGSFKDPFIARYVSDGTIKMFAYLLLLYDPKPHPLLCIEEPENQLYPSLLAELVDEFRDYANRGGQVFISTHSPDLLNAATPEQVFWLVKENGFTQVKRASDDPIITALYEEGDQLGYLWRERYFKGSDPQ